MPLKFLKKCRQYNVTSKNLFVISVHHLLDTTTTVDCTISSESKGQECLDNVCQRLLIQQPEFFGLRYVVKGKEDEMKWIDLERSLSRQLEKYAAGTKIFLRVRHYVTTGVRHLSDEVTRYYYFLQLKSDIYEGKIACDIRTAILLALYCRQAEYDSYQSDKQSKDYLKKSLVLPKNLQGLANDDNLLDSLILEVLQQHGGIQHLTTTQAEEMYIQCCQQLEGYGEERFQAKDNLGNDLILGLAINGMVVTAENGRQYFPWKDFHTVTIDKRTIRIEQHKTDGTLFVGSFIFSEADTARYFWKLCITQHKFFKRYIDEDSPSIGEADSHNGITIDAGMDNLNASPFSDYDMGDSREDLLLEQRAIYTPGSSSTTVSIGNPYHATTKSQHPSNMQINPHGSTLMSSNISLATSHQSGGGVARNITDSNSTVNGSVLHMGQPGRNGGGASTAQNWLNKDYSREYVSAQHLSNSILDTRLQSSSCQDLSNNNPLSGSSFLSHSNNNNNNNQVISADVHERERLKAMLPTYRPAPDYETAVQLKYRSPTNELHSLSPLQYQAAALAAHNNAAAAYYAGSQPDVHQAAGVYGEGLLLGHVPTHRYPDVAQPAAALHAHHHLNAAAAVAAAASAVNFSPANNIYVDLSQHMHMIRSKPRLNSSSTPDLAMASHRPLLGYRAYVSGSSPDLVSNRNILNSQYSYVSGGNPVAGNGGGNMTTSSGATMLHQYPYVGHSQTYLPPHGTFENLNIIEEQPSIMSQLRQAAAAAAAAATTVRQNCETPNSPILAAPGYRSGAATTTTTQTNIQPAALQRNAINGSIEPIYENVPLPQYNNNNNNKSNISNNALSQRNVEERLSGSSGHNIEATMRKRTSSIQSAPGGMNGQNTRPQNALPPPTQITQIEQHTTNDVTDEVSINIKKFTQPNMQSDRSASTEMELKEPIPAQRTIRAASAAPAISGGAEKQPIKMTPPPRQHKTVTKSLTSNEIGNITQSTTAAVNASMRSISTPNSKYADNSLVQHFSAINLSGHTTFITSSSTASAYNNNSTLETIASNNSTASSSTSKSEKQRKKRWHFLGRSKTPDKQKSATLGREKANNTNAKLQKIKLAQDDLNLHHRWSTGVPKLQPISGQYSKEKLSQILTDKLNDPQLFMEFEAIPKRRELARYDCALMPDNSHKNSDPNFLPYDDNRVRLTPTMENRHGYVNASHISATVGTKQRFYIVAQSPRDELTTRIFWQCVWEADVYLIVQLSEDLNYIPPTTHKRVEFGQFQVYQEFSQTTDRCITSKLRLYHIQSRRYRSVWHLNYIDWGEQNCPRDINHFLDFLEELNSVRMASINEVPPGHNTNPPVLLHCLEGGGRSGVTLTADLLLYTLDHNEDLDIPRVIGQLRHQRDSIIPCLAQYKFIYSILVSYLKRTRLI